MNKCTVDALNVKNKEEQKTLGKKTAPPMRAKASNTACFLFCYRGIKPESEIKDHPFIFRPSTYPDRSIYIVYLSL